MKLPALSEKQKTPVVSTVFSVFSQHPFLLCLLATLASCGVFMNNNDTDLSSFSLFVLFVIYTVFSAVAVFFIAQKHYANDKLTQYSFFTVLVTLGLIVVFSCAAIQNNIIAVFGFALLLSVGLIVFLIKRQDLTVKSLSAVIIFLGFALRLTYILYTTIYERQHDNYSLGNVGGHLGYITNFWNTPFSLPQEDILSISQYYHPPLHHFTVGLFLNCLKWLGFDNLNAVGECIQYLTMFYSTVCVILFYKILRFFRIDGLPLLLGLSVIAFHPTLIILSGSTNNDILCIMLMLGAVYHTLMYYQNSTLVNILKIALCVGFAMMSKMSGWMVAPAIAFVFIVVAIRQKNKIFSVIRQWTAFGVVCVPLGLWWSVRCFIQYDMPFGYVMRFNKTIAMYLGDTYTIWQRLTDFSPFQFESVYDQYRWYHCPYYEYNPTIGLFKTAMFDEAQYGSELQLWAVGLFWINVALAVIALVAMVYLLIIRKSLIDTTLKIFLWLLYAVSTASYYLFCLKYPFTCTMNIRYTVMSVFTGVIFLCFLLKALKQKTGLLPKMVSAMVYTVAVLFCIFSVVTYLKIGYIPAVYDGVVLQ